MIRRTRLVWVAAMLAIVALIAACGGGSGGDANKNTTEDVTGVINGTLPSDGPAGMAASSP